MGLSWLFVADYLISGQEIRGKEEQRIKDKTERALLQTDLYIPRKCHWTHKLIPSTDHGAVQIRIANLSPNGICTVKYSY